MDLIGELIDLLFWVSVGKNVADRPTTTANVPPGLDPGAWAANSLPPARRSAREPIARHDLLAGRLALIVLAGAIVAVGAAAAFRPAIPVPDVDLADGSALLVAVILGPFIAMVASCLIGAGIAVLAAIHRLDITLGGAALVLVAGTLVAPVAFELVLFVTRLSIAVFHRPGGASGQVAGTSASTLLASMAIWLLPALVGVTGSLLLGRALARTDAFGRPRA
jgi:hypothetical protein